MAVRMRLEADNGTADSGETIWPNEPEKYSGTSLYEKLEAYTAFISAEHFREKWGIPNLWILFVFRDGARLKRTMAKFASGGGAQRILFQLAEPTASPGYLFTRPWARVGHGPLFLNQP